MELLDSIGRRYGQRPSVLLGVRDEFQAMSIDLHAHNAGAVREAKELWELKRKRHGR